MDPDYILSWDEFLAIGHDVEARKRREDLFAKAYKRPDWESRVARLRKIFAEYSEEDGR